MNKEELIEDIRNHIFLYKPFTCPDYPGLGVYTNQYKEVLVNIFSHTKNPYSLVYTDVNKLSVVNERYGKETGDKTLYTLLCIFLGSTSPLSKNSATLRIGGDEFITFVPNMEKEQIQKYFKVINGNIERQSDYLYGSSLAFGVEDSTAGNLEQLIAVAEHQVNYQKYKNRKKDTFLTQATNSKVFVELPIPDNISEEQQEKWETLNTLINILVDNHLRDIRPSGNDFKYNVEHLQKDAKTFLSAFGNLLESTAKKDTTSNLSAKEDIPMTHESALMIHSLFQGKEVDLNSLNEGQLSELDAHLEGLCENLIRDKHSRITF